MPWIRRMLRDTKVFVRARKDGSPDVGRDGRVDIKYKLDENAKVYRAALRNLGHSGEEDDDALLPDVETGPTQHDPAAIVVYTDGACSGNPGPMGIGVVIMDGGARKEISEFLGVGTNNIAELTAIERALDAIGERGDGAAERPVVVHADSSYAIGLLSLGWKAKANTELVERIRRKAARFPKLRFVKVEGHAGVAENERCDELARDAIRRGA
jgi:ribonuclease HI